MDFKDKVVLVTGSAKGLGASIIEKFASLNANVVINYNNSLEDAIKLETKIKQRYNVKVLKIKCDITSEIEVKNMIKEIMGKLGKIDILIGNAGITIEDFYENKTIDNFKKTLNTNLLGNFIVTREVAPLMYENKCGSIVYISSTDGLTSFSPINVDYNASKAALNSLTHDMAIAYAPYVRVNAVAPGFIETDMIKIEDKEMEEMFIKEESAKIYLGRFAKKEEIANVVCFLSSNLASYINSEIIKVDGGM